MEKFKLKFDLQDTFMEHYDKGTLNTNKSNLHQEVLRFSSAEWFEEITKQDVTLIGCGGIGSWTAFNLARLHVHQLQIFDPDKIEKHNLAGQLFSNDNIGGYKVTSASVIAQEYSNYYNTQCCAISFNKNYITHLITICALDNMVARKEAFYKWKETYSNNKNALFIDGRLSPECLQVFAITGDDIYNQERYEKEFLFTDEEALTETCSYKQTTFMAMMIGGVITNLFVNHIANIQADFNIRSIPFFTEYDGTICNFKTLN